MALYSAASNALRLATSALAPALDSPALGYSPPCMVISAGHSATFVGSCNTHPLIGGQRLYPFSCDSHAPTMAGAIWVQ